ncbi:MAG: hypothetical protein ABFS39_17720 [Pseudomonadota bacterium]
MGKQVQITLDQAVYDRLLELKVPPFSDMNAVVARLLFHNGRKSREAAQVEDDRHYSFEEELQRDRDGVYAGSGISS